MFIEHTPEQKDLRAELSAYFDSLMTPEIRDDLVALDGGRGFRELVARLGADGWPTDAWAPEISPRVRTPRQTQ